MLLSSVMSCAQNKTKAIVDNFVNDLRTNHLTSPELIDKYFTFSETLGEDKKKETVIPILTTQFSLIRDKLNSECTEFEIVDYTNHSDIIKSLKLKEGKYDITNIYYIICNNSIVIPVLTDGTKLLSIMTYSKTENGTKTFIVFE